MTQIIKFRYPGLWHSEYPLVVNRLIDVIGRHDPEALHLQRSYQQLAAFRPLLSKIEVQERADRNSALLSELDQQRDTLYNVIFAVSKALKRTPMAEISAHATRVQEALKKHGTDIAPANYTAQTQRTYDLVADCRRQPDVMNALTAMSLTPLFERMDEINIQFDRLFMERKKQQAETERVDVRAIRLDCDKAIANMWAAIEFCMAEYGEENYKPLVNAINALNAYYKQQLAARATRRKAKQNVEDEKPIEPEK